ncbi:MAG: methyltransferase domain-containing protein [Planctomycetota bacterium]|nr:methyltransferase domain-containing protein [Planctomycetota bacterium]
MAERILNFGSGSDVAPDEIGVDLLPLPGVGVVCDLDAYPLPFRTDSIDRVRSYHCFEHLSDMVGLMEDLHRILKPGGILEVTVPHFGHIGYWRDPTHKRPFAYGTFDYFVRGRKPAPYTSIEFEYVSQELNFGSGIRAAIGSVLSKLSVRSWEKYYRTAFSAKELRVVLRALPSDPA